MGCISAKQHHANKSNTRAALTEPSINQLGPNSQFNPQPPICGVACGYTFTPDLKADHLHRSNTQLSSHSTDISPSAQLTALIKKCQHYYQLHDIDTANDYLGLVQNLCSKYENDSKHHELQQIMHQNNRILGKIKEEYNDIIQYEHQILKGGWVEKSNRKGVRVSTRREDQTVGVLVESIVDEPFQVLITFCIEMDLYQEFMPFMKVSRQEKIVDRNCRIGYTENHIPIVSVREAFFQGIGYNRLKKNNTLFLFTRSIHNRPDLQEKLGYKCQVHEDYVQLEYKYFVLWYEPLSQGKGKVTLAMNVDTKLNFIPMWIQDKISQDFGEEFFQNIIKLSKKFKGSQWEKNTNANPQLFLFFKNAIDRRLAEMEEAQKSRSRLQNTNASSDPNMVSWSML